MNKTCQNCKHYIAEMYHCQKNDVMAEPHNTCEDFEATVITNGDKIRQGSNKALVIFKAQWDCNTCAYHIPKGDNGWSRCKRPKDKTCIDGMLVWLDQEAKDE